MKRALFLKKLSMSSLINDSGSVVPVTVLEYVDQEILSVKTKESDGYEAIQISFGKIAESKLNKPKLGVRCVVCKLLMVLSLLNEKV